MDKEEYYYSEGFTHALQLVLNMIEGGVSMSLLKDSIKEELEAYTQNDI